MPDVVLSSRLLRFVAVGVLNTAFSYSVYVVLVYAGLHFAAANLVATAFGIVFSFRTQGALVFGDRGWNRLRRFVPAWIFLYAFNSGLIALMTRSSLDPYTAGGLALLPTVALSYIVQKRFVFKTASSDSPSDSATAPLA